LGGSQTGIYPKESPGGWHILGRTPLSLFDRQKQPPVWAKPGERIQFIPIDVQQYHDWKLSQPQFVEQ
jgi:inhibitor of KinA